MFAARTGFYLRDVSSREEKEGNYILDSLDCLM